MLVGFGGVAMPLAMASSEVNHGEDTTNKGKAVSDYKAKWTEPLSIMFFEICDEAVKKNYRPNTYFTRAGWNWIVDKFYDKSGKKYSKEQLKNHWDACKKDWLLWNNLMTKETGISVDYSSGSIQATDEWWELKIKEKPEYAKFRNKNLEKYTKYYEPLYRGTVAKGEKAVTPTTIEGSWIGRSSSAKFNEEPRADEVEDFGDNGEELDGDNNEANVEIRGGDIEFPPPTTSMKRQKIEKPKSSAAMFKEQIDNVLSVISTRSTATYPPPEVLLGPSIEECHTVMADLPNMIVGSKLWMAASSILMKKEARQTFMLQPTPECKLEWLKFHTEIFLGQSQSK